MMLPTRSPRSRSRPARAAIAVSLVLATSPLGAVEREDFSLFATVASDYVFRGVSQTREDPAVQAGLSFEHASGWFGGVWASTVDFPDEGGRVRRPSDLEIDLWVGYGVELGSRWGLAVDLRQYEYPGDHPENDYDYAELGVALQFDRSVLALGYSEDALGFDFPGVVVELTHRRDLPWRADLLAGIGFYDLDARYPGDYLFWNLTAGRSFGRLRFELGYFDTDDRAESTWGERAGERLVATVTVRIL